MHMHGLSETTITARLATVHNGHDFRSGRQLSAWMGAPGQHGRKRVRPPHLALAPAADRGEIFGVKVGNRLYYPQAFLGMDREAVAAICRALGDLGANEKLMFWLREHGPIAGKSVAAALEAGTALTKVERLATAWARERGASRVATAA